ncbi:hypothetical protein EI74_0466 [Mycoplasma testudineum]|uniref:Uncharacterized protein n=1 Tax=Mycoplasma testudineum TaxID=244584 RepID=A0A4R6IFC5_9MOLU|nr:hypothetical protein [Mycoplasma testudineum]OYD26853.1 hypothetical protein CG473_01950 [Mycoplasma testudineum]TDO20388.1 hypothetical protein EI74_0466 [Mycoplasma testudineum]
MTNISTHEKSLLKLTLATIIVSAIWIPVYIAFLSIIFARFSAISGSIYAAVGFVGFVASGLGIAIMVLSILVAVQSSQSKNEAANRLLLWAVLNIFFCALLFPWIMLIIQRQKVINAK